MARIFPHKFFYQDTFYTALASIGKTSKGNYYHVQVFDSKMIAILGGAHIRYTESEKGRMIEDSDEAKRELLHIITRELNNATYKRNSRVA